MYGSVIGTITSTLSASLGLPVRSRSELSSWERDVVLDGLRDAEEHVVCLSIAGQHFMSVSLLGHPVELLLAGPYRQSQDPDSDAILLSTDEVHRVQAALDAAATGLRKIVTVPQRLLDTSRQMEILSSAIIAISGELDVDTVLQTITDLARTFASAKYAALGLPNSKGGLETFITAGISPALEGQIGHRPSGLGLLGTLLREPKPVRVQDLTTHPDFVGFPKHHPAMKSFLGVPILARGGEIIGSIYLAEKRSSSGFTVDDEMLIELLARHAAVAIENARLYRRLEIDERRLGQILDQLPAAVMLIETDPERIVVINRQAQRLLDIDHQPPILVREIESMCTFYNALDEKVGVGDTPLVRCVRTGEVVEREELTVTNRAGVKHDLLVNSAPVWIEGAIDAYICVFQDITEIRDADRLKDDFLSLVSHELRTPLTTIHGGAQLLLKESDHLDREIRDDLLADIHRESARLAAVIQNMVRLTHVRAERVNYEPEPVLLRRVAGRCVRQLVSLDPSREYRVNIGPEIVAMADSERVDEMLRNVVHNALKYTPDGTPIEVSARAVGDFVELSVRDYGPGIPEHEVPRVFDRFERGGQAGSSTSGMGLGLYLVRLLVEAQGGAVTIELPEDGGTRVIFSLPRAVADE